MCHPFASGFEGGLKQSADGGGKKARGDNEEIKRRTSIILFRSLSLFAFDLSVIFVEWHTPCGRRGG